MAFGFPARFTEKRTFQLSEEDLFTVVKSAFGNLGWRSPAIDGNQFQQSLHNSPMTFGEEFTVTLLPDGIIQAESVCVAGGIYGMPQIFDFGANRQNVEAFFAQIEREINNETKY